VNGLLEAVTLFLAGIAAGTINTVVGSGSLVTFPALLAFGYAPVTANITNNLGVLPGSISGALAYRRELRDQWPRALRLGSASLLGGLGGALLLLWLPAAAFAAIVPALILLACVLVVIQPWLRARIATHPEQSRHSAVTRIGGVFATGLYGGYFGAAQGVLLMAVLGIVIPEDLQRLNALKNVLVATANTSAAVVFIVRGGIAWEAAGIIAVGSVIGGQLGARIGRRLPALVYRAVIVVIGLVAFVRLVAL
jgi:uncharacterized protein